MSYSETVTKNDLKNIIEQVSAIDGTDMTQAEIEAFVEGLDVSGINAVDYIVEQGTSGNWSYRKWNSGIGECWGIFSFTNVSQAGTITPFLYNTITTTPNFPFTYTATPAASVCGFKWGSGLCLANIQGVNTTKVSALQIYTTAIGDKAGWYGIYAIGRWK